MAKYSFTFCGKDVEDIGLHYVPENQDTYVYKPAEYEVSEQINDSHNGGYYFGHVAKPKQFVLRCYYEKQDVNDGFMTQLYSMFRRGKSGKLVFSSRPWAYYTATVISVDSSKMLNLENGLVTISMKAYYPYALTDYEYIPDDVFDTDMLANSAMFTENILPSTTYTSMASGTTVLLYNGGTEKAALTIDIAGDVGTGVSLYNRTNGQMCEFCGLTSSISSATKYVEYDGFTGNTYWVSNDDDDGKNAFLYHQRGSIELEPAYPIMRDVDISATAGTSTLTSTYSSFDEGLIGKYVYADGEFRKIVNVPDEHTLTVNENVTNAVSNYMTSIVTMNEIFVSPIEQSGTMNLSYLAFKRKHTFA